MKDFFKKKMNILIVILVFIVVIVSAILLLNKADDDDGFKLDNIYEVYPEDVQELYSNMVEVTCNGDLFVDNLLLEGEEVKVENLDKNILLDYVLSNLSKSGMLSNKFDYSVITDATDKLLFGDINFEDIINNYSNNEYVYTLNDGEVTRKKEGECDSSVKYVSHLNGYLYNEDRLSIDVNIGYLKDGILYNLLDEKLGEYEGEIKELEDLYLTSPYYRFNYVSEDKEYKLQSIELNQKF